MYVTSPVPRRPRKGEAHWGSPCFPWTRRACSLSSDNSPSRCTLPWKLTCAVSEPEPAGSPTELTQNPPQRGRSLWPPCRALLVAARTSLGTQLADLYLSTRSVSSTCEYELLLACASRIADSSVFASPLSFIVIASTTDYSRKILNASSYTEPCLVRSAKQILLRELKRPLSPKNDR